MELFNDGVYLINGELVKASDTKTGISKEEASKNTIAYQILQAHNTSSDPKKLKIKFDAMISHDITFVGIIQTARASGLTEFPIPYVLTNCHNSLCAVGGTINEDDHMFGLTCAKKFGGMYVPPHQAVIHQFAREKLAGCGKMILGSDSHTRYGALGTIAIGEGGGELAKQLLKRTYDVDCPEVVLCYLEGTPSPAVGPHDVALALVGATFDNAFVKNRVIEFVGPGINNLSMDFRIGVDVMTTETTCLSSIWATDEKTKEFLDIHFRSGEYKELNPGEVTYYDRAIRLDLSKIVPMIAMPFHPSKAYPISDVKADLSDYLHECEERAKVSFGENCGFTLTDKIINGNLYVEQGIIAGCAGGGFENICDAADILDGASIGNGKFTLSVYPASMPVYMELIKNGAAAKLMSAGAVLKTAFCGPCFGAGDTPSNNAFSIRHSTRNFPNREGSKVQNGQIASVALMDAKSIAATAANKGFLTGADELVGISFKKPKYFFDKTIYDARVLDCIGHSEPDEPIQFGPNIKDWPSMTALTDDIMLKCVARINDPVTTTDELIPSGETSSFRSNPLGLAEYTLSRRVPAYVSEAKKVRALEACRKTGESCEISSEFIDAFNILKSVYPQADEKNTAIGSTIYAKKPGDGSAREQAASCQKVLGAWANVAGEYATKRYRSNLINWGMLPFLVDGEPGFDFGDYIFIPDVRKKVLSGDDSFRAIVISKGCTKEIELKMSPLTQDERKIITAGCLINYYRE